MHGIEDIARSVGSYIPLSAGRGLSYYTGSISIDPERLAVTATAPRQPDEYIPSNPAPVGEPEPAARENVQNRDEDDGPQEDFTPEELRVIDDLRARDQEVRAHEQAHMAAGGGYTGGATYQFETGPDNRQYAVGGEVSIDASPIRDNPEATIAKMQVVRGAALAPATPSGQDRAVAAAAARHEANAHIDLREMRAEEAREEAGQNNRSENQEVELSRISVDATTAYANPFNPVTFQPVIDLAG
ncbi:MAG: hypothetical protein LBC70_09905 [Chitinispirillales bacterium]|jgi:hypothetical protein|nr:hypothetical protein [Chitinispirillales bacterium]